MNPIRKLITDSEDVSLSIFDASGSDRALTEVTSQVFLLILAIGLIGGLAVTLGGVTDGILPGPEGNVEIDQDGSNLSITIDTLDDDVGAVGIITENGISESDGDNIQDPESDGIFDDAQVIFDPVTVGTTATIEDLEEDETVNIIAYEEESGNANRIATYTVGPGGN